jgi:hypothetical protein
VKIIKLTLYTHSYPLYVNVEQIAAFMDRTDGGCGVNLIGSDAVYHVVELAHEIITKIGVAPR